MGRRLRSSCIPRTSGWPGRRSPPWPACRGRGTDGRAADSDLGRHAAAQRGRSGEDGAEAAQGRFSCRLRAADGSWRHVACAVLLYQVPGEPARMLVTARDVSDEVALRNQVAHLTFHDGLTGLPNRAYLEDRVRASLPRPRHRRPAAGVIFLDLDRFTAVNDSAGHGAGDLVLAQAARRLRAAVPARETVARWGGDEFAVLAEQPGSVSEITELAERVAAAIAGTPFKVADREIGLTASVGVALAATERRARRRAAERGHRHVAGEGRRRRPGRGIR